MPVRDKLARAGEPLVICDMKIESDETGYHVDHGSASKVLLAGSGELNKS